MEITYQDETPWLFEIGDFLSNRELEYTDVTEVVMMVKNAADDLDASALITKTWTGGTLTWTAEQDGIVAGITSSDFGSGKMEIGGTYYVYLGFSADGYTGVYLEAKMKDHVISIVQDGIRG